MTSIDYSVYSKKMRKQLSNKQMIMEDGSINHIYFNCKKGEYWSQCHNRLLQKARQLYGDNVRKIAEYMKQKGQNKNEAQISVHLQIKTLLKKQGNIQKQLPHKKLNL